MSREENPGLFRARWIYPKSRCLVDDSLSDLLEFDDTVTTKRGCRRRRHGDGELSNASTSPYHERTSHRDVVRESRCRRES